MIYASMPREVGLGLRFSSSNSRVPWMSHSIILPSLKVAHVMNVDYTPVS